MNNRFSGYVDIGNGHIDDTTSVAKDAMLIMAVSVNDSWKYPWDIFSWTDSQEKKGPN